MVWLNPAHPGVRQRFLGLIGEIVQRCSVDGIQLDDHFAWPVELGYELDTGAACTFSGTLPGAFTAHPKFDPLTGELHAMCHSWARWRDHITYVVVSADGRVSKTVDIPLPGMVMVHDMSLTRSYAVVYDLPVTVDFDLVAGGRFPFRWNPDYTPRVGLLPRTSSDAADIFWCELDPCYAYHPMNAYDADDGTVVIDLCRYDAMFARDLLGPAGDCLPSLYRWTVDPVRRTVRQTRLDDRTLEFPRVAPAVSASRHRAKVARAQPALRAKNLTYFSDITPAEQFGKLLWATGCER
jgi:carotenoid cleavage dioxygenase